MLSRGVPAILKQDFQVTSIGNEIISPVSEVAPLGARRTVVADSREELENYLAERWSWLTGGGRDDLVIETYFADSAPIYAELRVEDGGVELTGHGGMRMKPVLNGSIVPTSAAELEAFPQFLGAERSLCESLHAIGCRGIVSVAMFATAELVLPALLESRGFAIGWSGPLLAGFSVVSVVGAFCYGLRSWPGSVGVQSLVFLFLTAGCVSVLAVLPGLPAIAGACWPQDFSRPV